MRTSAVIHFRKGASRFLDGFAPAEVKTIMSAARQRQYLATSTIVNQGHPAEHFFLLFRGRARYFHLTRDGRRVNLKRLTSGDILSPAALLARPSEYLLNVEAVNNSVVLVWDRIVIRELVTRYPRLIDNTLMITHDYLAFYRDAHTSLSCDSGPQRLAHVLAGLASTVGHRVAGGIEIDVYNEELANEANVNSFTVSRLLSDWHRKGILTKLRGKVLIRSPQRLFQEEDLT